MPPRRWPSKVPLSRVCWIALSAAGFTVFACVRKEADKAGVLAECGKSRSAGACARLIPLILDVTKADQIDAAYTTVSQWVAEHNEPFVALVNNAGIGLPSVVEITPLQAFRDGCRIIFEFSSTTHVEQCLR